MEIHDTVRLLIVVAAAAVVFGFHRQIRAAIENFRNNFPRGGPRTPMHPSPVGEDRFLRRDSR